MSKPLNEQEIKARGRELENQKWDLPARFKLTAELMELPIEELRKKNPELAALRLQMEEQQRVWAAQVTTASGTPSVQDVWRANSVQMAEELRVVIERLRQQCSAILTAGAEGDLVEIQKAVLALRARRAESLAEHGRFDLAAAEHPDAARRDGYLAILDALYRPDDEALCKCEPHRGTGAHSALEVSRTHVRKEVFSIAHGRVVFLLACTGCGAMNAVPDLPKHLSDQRRHRARALQLARNMTPEDAARTLTARGHTTEKLLQR